MGAQRIQYQIVGRYMNGTEVVGYACISDKGKKCNFTREQACYLAGREQFANAKGIISSDNVVLSGVGCELSKLPSIQSKSKAANTQSNEVVHELNVEKSNNIRAKLTDNVNYSRVTNPLLKKHLSKAKKVAVAISKLLDNSFEIIVDTPEDTTYCNLEIVNIQDNGLWCELFVSAGVDTIDVSLINDKVGDIIGDHFNIPINSVSDMKQFLAKCTEWNHNGVDAFV